MHTKVRNRDRPQLLTSFCLWRPADLHRLPVSSRLTGYASASSSKSSYWTFENSVSCWIGTDTTFGDPHAVDIRITPNGVERVCVITMLMTAATRPSQSNTGAPEAP